MHHAGVFRVVDEPALRAHLRAHPFVTLTAAPQGRLFAAHAPVVIRDTPQGLALDFHLARPNPLAEYLATGFSALMISLGPDAYISPDWYGSADQVPTWNYTAVEAQGEVEALDDAGLTALLDDLSAQEEQRLAPKPPWTRAKMSPGRFEAMSRAILGGRLWVSRLEGTFKLGQNKSDAERSGAISGLKDHPIAALMATRP